MEDDIMKPIYELAPPKDVEPVIKVGLTPDEMREESRKLMSSGGELVMDKFEPVNPDVGADMNLIENHDSEFKNMIEEMFKLMPTDFRMTEEGMKSLLKTRKNELTENKTEEDNGGNPGGVLATESPSHTPKYPSPAVPSIMQEFATSIVIPVLEEGGDDDSGKSDEE